MAIIALVRPVSASLARCELTHVARSAIDVPLAQAQHAAYCEALRVLGCEVIALPELSAQPDAVFVEDTAIVLDELAVITRPGAPSRRAEVDSVAAALGAHRRIVQHLDAPATLDGGDVLLLGRTLYVGEGGRSSADGVAQLRCAVAPFGYRVESVAITDCLHLKSAVTQVAPGVVLLQPAWVDRARFDGMRVIEVADDEPHAANALAVGDRLLSPANMPRTHALLRAQGIAVFAVDVSELQKAEGAVTCCSLLLRTDVRDAHHAHA